MTGSNPLRLKLQLAFQVLFNDIGIETYQILVATATVCIVAGKAGSSWLIFATVTDDVQGVIWEAFITQNTGPVMTAITKSIGVGTFTATIFNVIISYQQTSVN